MLQRIAFDAIAILSGLSFSIQILPEPFKSLSFFVPTYYLLTTTRYALLNRYLPQSLPDYLIAAPVITLLALVIGLLSVRRSVKVAKKRGTLLTY
jgi:ABC-type multidrug transport system permease subunit